MKKKASNKTIVIILLLVCIAIILIPLLSLRGAQFGGSDDAGAEMVSEVTDSDFEPWFTPVLETIIGGELPGEMESFFFCVQTGIGVGVIAFVMGRFVERKKWTDRIERGELEEKGTGENDADAKNPEADTAEA